MAVTLWQHVDAAMNGKLYDTLYEWHVNEGLGTPSMAKRLTDQGFSVEQRTVWRWLKQEGISRKGEAK